MTAIDAMNLAVRHKTLFQQGEETNAVQPGALVKQQGHHLTCDSTTLADAFCCAAIKVRTVLPYPGMLPSHGLIA